MTRSFTILFLIIYLLMVNVNCASKKMALKTDHLIEAAQTEPSVTDFSEQSTWLLGYLNPLQFERPPYSDWYLKGFNEYQPDTEIIEKISNIDKKNLTVKVVLGTWCPDSRREVPRFMKIMDLCKFPAEQLTFIGVDNAKLSPIGNFDMLDIQRVPTFIIEKNKVEIGRIIENPVTSLEKDLLNILTRNE